MKIMTTMLLAAALCLLPAAARGQDEGGAGSLSQAKKALEAGKWNEALKLYGQAIKEAKDSQEAQYGKGLVYIRKGDYKGAKGYCKGFIAKNKQSPWAHACLGYTQLVWKRSSLAVKSFEDALAIDPDFSPAIAGMGHAQLLLGKTEEAEKKFKEALDKNGVELEAVLGLAELYLSKNRNKDALKTLEAVKDTFSGNPRFLFWLASARRKGPEAEQLMKKALEIRSGWAEGYELLAKIHFRNKNFEACIASAEKAVEIEPDLTEAPKFKGVCQFKTDQYEEAITTLQGVMVKFANSAMSMYYIGRAYDALNDYAQAEQAYKDAMNMNVKYSLPVVFLGYLYYRTGKPTSATNITEKALKINPKSSLANQVLGDIYFERSQLDKAKEYYKQALKGDLLEVDKDFIKDRIKEIEGK
jgi:protein O-GlcNAc transferase